MSQGLCEFIRLQTPRDDSYSVKCDPSRIAVVACSSSGLCVSAGVTLGTFARSAEPSRCRLPQSHVGLNRHDSFPFRSLIQAHDTAELGFDLKQVATPRKADLCPKEDYRPGSDHSIRCALSWLLLRNLHDSINCERYSLQTLLTVCALRAHCKPLARRALRSYNSNRRRDADFIGERKNFGRANVASIALLVTREK